MEWLTKSRRTTDLSVQQLKELYAELLSNIVIATNERDLGRRQADPESQGQRRSSRSLQKTLVRKLMMGETMSTKTPVRTRDLATAFNMLSAVPDYDDRDGINVSAANAIRQTGTLSAMSSARIKEANVVRLIRRIGEIVAYGDQPGTALRGDAIFEYFCEKDMLALFVDIGKSQPSYGRSGKYRYHKVSWSPHVKAQILQTVSVLVSNTQDAPSLYYLLSNNHLNDLVESALPLHKWSEPALEEIIPVYAALLKSLAVQLGAAPDVLPFLTVREGGDQRLHVPVFSAAVDVISNTHVQSDSQVYNTSFGIVIDVLRMADPSVRAWLSSAKDEHHRLATHVCSRILKSYERLSMLTTGPVVDPTRSNAIEGQLKVMEGYLESLNDLLSSGVRSLNVRLCDTLIERVFGPLLRNMAPEGHLLDVGAVDVDVIPEQEAKAQTAVVVLAHFFNTLAYSPVIRMLSVAVFHPHSPAILANPASSQSSKFGPYELTKALNTVVATVSAKQSRTQTNDGLEIVKNPFRNEVLNILSGREGEWRFIALSLLVESALNSPTLDLNTLMSLSLIPQCDESGQYPKSQLGEALTECLSSRPTTASFVSRLALERAGALTQTILYRAFQVISTSDAKISNSPQLIKSLRRMRSHFFAIAWSFKEQTGVSQLYVELLQSTIAIRYQKLIEDGRVVYGCPMDKFSCTEHIRSADSLVRKFRNVGSHDVEDAKFAMRMALHFRALYRLTELEFYNSVTKESSRRLEIHGIDIADELLVELGDLKDKPALGTDLDLHGRMTFRFVAPSSRIEQQRSIIPEGVTGNRLRTLSGESSLRRARQLFLVLDPTDLFVVKPVDRSDVNRGTIVCVSSLRSLIGCAADGEWLHVAIRNMPDVGFLIKNGNMALRFESVGTCLIVCQYLERLQGALRYDLMEKAQTLFEEDSQTSAHSVVDATQDFAAKLAQGQTSRDDGAVTV